MMNVGGLTMSLEGLLGLVITALGLWFVIKQLNETRLASQMEGVIALLQIETQATQSAIELVEFTDSGDYKKMDAVEVHAHVRSKDDLRQQMSNVQSLYELMGNLIKTGALDDRVAFEQFGYVLARVWTRT